MFTKRQLVALDKSLGARIERMQYSNRVKIRPYEEKLGRFAGLVMIILVTILLLIGKFSKPVMADITKEVVIQSIDTTLIDTPWRNVPKLKNGSPEQNEKIAYAWKISGYDIDFIYMLRGENGLFDHTRVHNSGANTVGVDYGLCGINSYFHPQIVNDPKFQDWKWQMDTCFQLWDGGVTFYGFNKDGIYF